MSTEPLGVAETGIKTFFSGEVRSHRRHSFLWQYFKEIKRGLAKCGVCHKVLSFNGGSTANLMRHLRRQHQSFAEKVEKSRKAFNKKLPETQDAFSVSLFIFSFFKVWKFSITFLWTLVSKRGKANNCVKLPFVDAFDTWIKFSDKIWIEM